MLQNSIDIPLKRKKSGGKPSTHSRDDKTADEHLKNSTQNLQKKMDYSHSKR